MKKKEVWKGRRSEGSQMFINLVEKLKIVTIKKSTC